MSYRLLAAVFAVCFLAGAETMSVDQLYAFIQSSEQLIHEGKMTDRELARYLEKTKLTERLDDRTVEELQGLGIGERTLEALKKLRDQSRTLQAGKAFEPPAPPRQMPPPSSIEQARIIDDVREYALNYTRRLPDFICTQVTRRYAAPTPGAKYGGRVNSEPSWRAMDVLTVRLSFFEQKEDYKLILVNNTVTNQEYRSLEGATTTGDFGSMLKEIFEPATRARFSWDHWGTLRSRLTMAFAYKVDKERSQWHIQYDRQWDLVPGYHGMVYVDPKTHEVLRVTLEAEGLPSDFPVKTAQTILDYDHQNLSGQTFLLPLKSRTIMAASDFMTRNDEEFRMYRKYSAESEIKFDTETPPPLPEEETTEKPVESAPPGR